MNSVIPDDGTVTIIGNSAFYGCSYLKSVTIPKSVMALEDYAFSGCQGLKEIIVPDSVETIGVYSFDDCFSLEKAKIPASVEEIGSHVFGFASDGSYIDNFVIEGVKGSAAEKYATEHEIPFIEAKNAPDEESNFYMDSQSMLMPNLKEKTTVSNVKTALEEYGISVTVKDAEGASLSEDSFVGTGYVVIDENENEYLAVVSGDVNGDGIIDATDYLLIKSYFLGK